MPLFTLIGFEDYILAAYAIMGTISALGYIPQIWTLMKSTGRSMSTPISAWTLWTMEAFATFLYAVFILKDSPAMILVGINFLSALVITLLIIYNRYYRFKPAEVNTSHNPLRNSM